MKKGLFSIIFTISITLLLCSCSNKQMNTETETKQVSSEPETSPLNIDEHGLNDFNFTFWDGFIVVDTHDNTIRNCYNYDQLGDDTAIMDFYFSEDDMTNIFNAFIQYDIYNMPEVLDPDIDVSDDVKYDFIYTLGDVQKKVSCWSSSLTREDLSEKERIFKDFLSVIMAITRESKEYNALPEAPPLG